MPRSLPPNALMLSMVAAPPWAWWLFCSLSFAGLFLWAMFVASTPIVTPGWWAIPSHTACIWLILAIGVMVCASASCTVWVLLLLSDPLARWYVDCPTSRSKRRGAR
jgi:hypothetical protein